VQQRILSSLSGTGITRIAADTS